MWTKGEPPWEYVELVLCRDVYHCPPSALEQEDLEQVLEHLTCLSVESEIQTLKAKSR